MRWRGLCHAVSIRAISQAPALESRDLPRGDRYEFLQARSGGKIGALEWQAGPLWSGRDRDLRHARYGAISGVSPIHRGGALAAKSQTEGPCGDRRRQSRGLRQAGSKRKNLEGSLHGKIPARSGAHAFCGVAAIRGIHQAASVHEGPHLPHSAVCFELVDARGDVVRSAGGGFQHGAGSGGDHRWNQRSHGGILQAGSNGGHAG